MYIIALKRGLACLYQQRSVSMIINLLYPEFPIRQMCPEFRHRQIVGLGIVAITVDTGLDYLDVVCGQEWLAAFQKLVREIGDKEISQ